MRKTVFLFRQFLWVCALQSLNYTPNLSLMQ